MPTRPARLIAYLVLLGASLLAPARVADAADPAVADAARRLDRDARDPFEQRERADAIRDLGRIGGPEAAEALVGVFADPFVHLRDHAVSAFIDMVRGDRANESVRWLANVGLNHRDPQVRRAAATALGFSKAPEAVRGLAARIPREREAVVLVAGGRSLLRLGAVEAARPLLTHRDPEVVEAVGADWPEGPDPAVAATLAQGLGRRDAMARAGAVLALGAVGALDAEVREAAGDDDDERVRIALADALARASADADVATEVLADLLTDESWRVRAAAIDACVLRREAPLVPLLIDRLAVEEGRLALDAFDALRAITGAEVGDDAELWRAWWSARPPDTPLPAPGKGPGSAARDEDRTTAFFDVPLRSRRVAFLLDCSGSMADPAVDGDPASKMDVARGELERTLTALSADARFDVFLYRYPSAFPPRPGMTRALGRLQPGTRGNTAKALRWLAGETPKGWGAFYDALVELLADDDVDTICFLSDGRPSRGTYDRDFRLIQELVRANRYRRVVVHTVLAGRARADRAFLEELALATGGRFSDALR